MSLSVMVLTHAQSVLDVFEEDDLLICRCLSKGNDMDVVGGFGMHNRNRNAFHEP